MSLAGNVIRNIPDVLLSAVSDKVLLRGAMLEEKLRIITKIEEYMARRKKKFI